MYTDVLAIRSNVSEVAPTPRMVCKPWNPVISCLGSPRLADFSDTSASLLLKEPVEARRLMTFMARQRHGSVPAETREPFLPPTLLDSPSP